MSAATQADSGARTRVGMRLGGGRFRGVDGALAVGIGIFAAALALALVGALFMVDPNRQDLRDVFAAPLSAGHPLGTDSLGRDVLSWIAHSITTSLKISIAIVALSALLGVAVGVVSAYVGGVLDTLLMRAVDLQLAIPPLLLFIAAAAVVGNSQTTLILLVSIVSWVTYARLVRTQVLIEKQRASIAAARLAGVGHVRIVLRHLLPSVGSVVLVIASLQLGFVLLWEASLSFVNLGVQPPATSLGFLIAQGRTTLAQAWWVVVFPGVMLALLLLAANLVGDGLRDYFGVDAEVVDK
ncbi:MAG: ABC transporter permease [Conexibacter sp.]